MKQNAFFGCLNSCFDLYNDNDSRVAFDALSFPADKTFSPDLLHQKRDSVRSVYESAFQRIEKEAAVSGFREDLLLLQRALYRELENNYSLMPDDPRHNFTVVVPVADRPDMLRNCVFSLIEQAELFGYGSRKKKADNRLFYDKIRLCIIDDSSDSSNISKIMRVAEEAKAAGIRTDYIGLEEQSEVIGMIPPGFGKRLSGLISEYRKPAMAHKGASVTRNIAFLYLLSSFDRSSEKDLFYFIDSDEEFRVKITDGITAKDIPFINYFYWLDRLFSSSDIEVLTGKVVGDPPVSPAVMINTFLDDLSTSLETLAKQDIHDPCEFHEQPKAGAFAAEYHDMGGLFGYNKTSGPKKFLCGLTGSHDAGDCFADLALSSLGFFYGQHPTRVQLYNHHGPLSETEVARTVYTGNYVFNSNGFRHFIPFAGLRLRMAGPALGRILKQRLGNSFVSANLPLLHRRTAGGKNEFRSGLVESRGSIDLSAEYNRQFWGDVMLFSIESLTALGYPDRCLDYKLIAETVAGVREKFYSLYRGNQTLVTDKIKKIRGILSDQRNWWNRDGRDRTSLENFRTFCDTAENNFGIDSAAINKVSEQIAEGAYTEKIIKAIEEFYEDDFLWNELLQTEYFSPPV